MRKFSATTRSFALACVASALALALGGLQRERLDTTLPATYACAGLSLDQAISMAERKFKARVVRADTQRSGNSIVYVLRLLNSAGRVWTVHVDAQSGQIL